MEFLLIMSTVFKTPLYFDGFRLGRNRMGDSYFNGVIDDVKIYDRVLSPLNIEFLYSIQEN